VDRGGGTEKQQYGDYKTWNHFPQQGVELNRGEGKGPQRGGGAEASLKSEKTTLSTKPRGASLGKFSGTAVDRIDVQGTPKNGKESSCQGAHESIVHKPRPLPGLRNMDLFSKKALLTK